MTLGPNGGSIPGQLVVGGDVSLLTSNDTLVVNGGIRFVGGTNPQPRCQALTGGLMYYAAGTLQGADSLSFCSQVGGPFAAYTWRQIQLAPVGVSGPGIRDAWGNYWDGYARSPSTYSTALSICNALGARLPSYTDITRSLNLFGVPAGFVEPAIWTSTISPSGYYSTVVSTLTTTDTAPATSLTFRCFWPATADFFFVNSNCYGPPTASCYNYLVYDFDMSARPGLSYAEASYECNMKGGSFPTFVDFHQVVGTISANYPNNGVNSYSSSIFFTGAVFEYVLGALDGTPLWNQFTDTTVLASGSASAFACVGRQPSVPIYPPSTTSCNGPCFTIARTTKTPLFADSMIRAYDTVYNASMACNAAGGFLPSLGMVADLIHQGWYTNNTLPIWTSSPSRMSTPYVHYLAVSGSPNYLYWDPTVFGSDQSPFNIVAYMCVFYSAFMPSSPFANCQTNSLQMDPTTFQIQCITKTNGNANGNAYGTVSTDSAGYTWDGQGRGTQTYSQAVATCEGVGARLPTLGEFYQYALIFTPSMPGDTVSTVYWTNENDPIDQQAMYISKGGITGIDQMTASYQVRCVWPPTPYGNTFGGHKCHGGCFQIGNYVVDAYDRPQATIEYASQECQFVGGRLPSFDEMTYLIRNGAPNGYYPCTSFVPPICTRSNGDWVVSSGGDPNVYWSVRWVGTGDPTWIPIHNIGGWSNNSTIKDTSLGTDVNQFRCLFTTNLS